MTAVIILLLIVAFLIARMFRSTGMWWKLVFAITAGLLVGVLSKGISNSGNEINTLTELVSTMNDSELLPCMQSLVATVTEGTTICQTGVAGNINNDEELFDALTNNNTFTNGRDSPAIKDDS